jgi:hypothetical protein
VSLRKSRGEAAATVFRESSTLSRVGTGKTFAHAREVSGICMELENLIGDVKGKMHKRKNREAEIPMLRSGADGFVVALKRL